LIDNIDRGSSLDSQRNFYERIGFNKWKQGVDLVIKESVQTQMRQLLAPRLDTTLQSLKMVNLQ
jgi:hypothetical protein